MFIWFICVGFYGEYEYKFIQENCVYVIWDDFDVDFFNMFGCSEFIVVMIQCYSEVKFKIIQNWVSQVWFFVYEMKIGDLVVIFLKLQLVVYIGEIIGDYQCQLFGFSFFFYFCVVKWIGEVILCMYFGKDLLFFFGVFMMICCIKCNNVEQCIVVMCVNGWKVEMFVVVIKVIVLVSNDEEIVDFDLDELVWDQIVLLILVCFKGYGLICLIEGIFKVQGYMIYCSLEGVDGGVDILVGFGLLGFFVLCLCIEVKLEDNFIGCEFVDKLLGVMIKFNVDQGLFVVWGGFKGNV